MGNRIVTWGSEEAKKTLSKRLTQCIDFRTSKLERVWERNERTVFDTQGSSDSLYNQLFQSDYGLAFGSGDVDNSPSNTGVNHTFKNLRFIHAQLSANPPSVVARPTSSDPDDHRKADAADRLIRFAIRKYNLQEAFDRCNLNCLLYGTGVIKTVWDPDGGDIASVTDEGEVEMEGDISIEVPSTWNLYIDPDAESWPEVRYMFEKKMVPYEEALYRWPDKRELLEAIRKNNEKLTDTAYAYGPAQRDAKYDAVEVYEYYEKGMPTNAMLGRYTICTKEGKLLEEVRPNPHRFSTGTDKQGNALPPTAYLPYHLFTDIDNPNRVWGRSFVEYEAPLQEVMNRVDSVMLDNLQAHGVARMILPEGTEIADDAITNSPWDIIKIKGTQPPHFMNPMPMPTEMTRVRDQLRQGIDEMAGVNEAMFGQMSRETSGFSLQYASNQGNMIRRRLFNKYVLLTESVFKGFLNLVKKHWSESHVIHVLGKEKAFEAVEIKGADIDGGFDLVVEYGASLSLDPMTRREEIMAMMPVFEKAGVPTRTILSMLKLNELEGLYDMVELAKDRQREYFEEMVATGQYLPPQEMEDHENMLAYAMHYRMTTEFKYLDEELKPLILQHIRERAQLAAQEVQPAGPPGAPGPAGAPGPLPAGPEMVGDQASAPAPGGAPSPPGSV